MKPKDRLFELRKTLGLTQQEMADEIGVSSASVSSFEKGTRKGSNSPAQNRIMNFLNNETIRRHFTEGKCYKIYGSGCLGSYNGKKVSASSGAAWERDCIFQFLRTEGIHHVFREVRGGWTRTYTDAQLVGKNVQEVSND